MIDPGYRVCDGIPSKFVEDIGCYTRFVETSVDENSHPTSSCSLFCDKLDDEGCSKSKSGQRLLFSIRNFPFLSHNTLATTLPTDKICLNFHILDEFERCN